MDATVTLAAVDDELLAHLVTVATTDATAGEVTAPITPGDDWTPERVAWFEDHHRRCRTGLTEPSGEATWAVLSGADPVGCVRLRTTDEPGVLETGIWLARSVRGRGISTAATRLVLDQARRQGARRVVADTAATNVAAQGLLRSAGFALAPAAAGRVGASVDLDDGVIP
ncbi:GNAT family N-acetyltransferase [Arsenicicoccus dermatophilus]|uniref:GNAT family N-acetyltransferase n=1 Tax=Arsenicicoccus dermatophilus TaxID=1076331 RepID=UPI001F4CBA10|nr:GNAT family N-acetyltransferase [Arsenicicoccus dermatophilus]MCH8614291.1 GNAT family N-acetyltransferase [Arsenicicoccus dermatophilus]